MANITFKDLPTRASLTNNDFFVINSSDKTTLPEGKVGFNTLKSALKDGLITTNYFFEGEKNVLVQTTANGINTININDDNGQLITFDNLNIYKKVFGSFQFECLRTGTVSLANAMCQYSLTWIPVNTAPGVPKIPQFLIKDAYVSINDTTVQSSSSSVQNTQTNSFVPTGNGNFRLTVKFTQANANAKAKVIYKITLFQKE